MFNATPLLEGDLRGTDGKSVGMHRPPDPNPPAASGRLKRTVPAADAAIAG